MSEQRAGYDLLRANQPQYPPALQPGTCELGAHLLEVLEDETAIIIKTTAINEMVSLEKEELYCLLQILQELFRYGRI